MLVTANNYTFRPLTGHHQVLHSMKRVEGCIIYNVTAVRQKLHCISYNPQPFSLDVQTYDGLLEAETCSC